MADGYRIQLASRLKKVAIDLYSFVEQPDWTDWAKYLTATAHLIDVSASDAESEITQLKRSLGGLTAKTASQANKINELETELALEKARIDKMINDHSPIKGMSAGYDS